MEIAARAQSLHLLKEPAGQHIVEAPRNSFMQPRAVLRLQREERRGSQGRSVGRALMKAGERPARHPEHFQRALDPLCVIGREPRRRGGIDQRQFRVHGRPAFCRGLGFHFGAGGEVGSRHRIQALEQGLEVQHGATHQQRHFAASIDLRDQPLRVGRELRGAVSLQGIADVDQVVRHAALARPARVWQCRCPCRDIPARNRR